MCPPSVSTHACTVVSTTLDVTVAAPRIIRCSKTNYELS